MSVQYELRRELRRIEEKERRWLAEKPASGAIRARIYEKVPPALSKTLEAAFEKAFGLLFLKGRGLVELSFDRSRLEAEFDGADVLASRTHSLRGLKRLERRQRMGQTVNAVAATLSGAGLGFAGLGLPDIPVFTSMVLKGVYEIAASYGVDYGNEEEQVYILRLIRAALTRGTQRQQLSRLLDSPTEAGADMGEETAAAARALSDTLLVEKFVQGIPVVGAVGGYVNNRVYTKISALAALKYKKRYIMSKLK